MSKNNSKSKKIYVLICFCLAIFSGALFGVYSAVQKWYKKPSREIPVAYSSDNNYVYPTIVSITSLLETANAGTLYKIYILVSGDLTADNREKFVSIKEHYQNCEVVLLDMRDSFSESEIGDWSTAMYYRLRLSGLLPGQDKCIYLDGDTIVCKDLAELYETNIDDFYVAGVADDRQILRKDYAKIIGIPDMTRYVCSGVLLWNLKKIREEGIEKKFDEFIDLKVNKEKVAGCPDQDAINAVCYHKMLNIPFKYNVMVAMNIDVPYAVNAGAKCFTQKVWEDGISDPVIIHYTGTKPWNGDSGMFQDQWIYYAKKTFCYNELCEKHPFIQ